LAADDDLNAVFDGDAEDVPDVLTSFESVFFGKFVDLCEDPP
jgi:hypothetical protein